MLMIIGFWEKAFLLMVGTISLGTVVAIIAWFGFDRLVLKIADYDKWWSIFRRLPLEGTVAYILKGGPGGPVRKVIHSVPGWSINEDGIFIPIPEPEGGYLRRELGVVLVWPNSKFHTRTRHYEVLEQVQGQHGAVMVPKTREGSEFFFQTVISIEIVAAEDKGNFPINAKATFTMRIIQPITAEFTSGKPEVQAMSAARVMAREYIGSHHFDELRGKVHPVPDNSLIELFGIEIIAMRLEEFNPVDPDSDYAKANRLKEINRLNADAAGEKAREIEVLSKAEEARVLRVYGAKAGVRDGGLIAMAEAIESSKPSTLVVGNFPTSIPLPPIK